MSTELTKYHALIQSFPLAQARLGMFKPGRYSGFDTMVAGTTGSGIQVKITHAGSVIRPVTNGNQWGDYEGVVLTPHGVVIKISDQISFGVAIGGGVDPSDEPYTVPGPYVTTDRTDIVYLEYQWIADDTGDTPVVGLIQGPAGGAIPSVGNPRTQVILGYIVVQKGATTIAGLRYIPAQVPLNGGANIITNFPELDNRYAQLAAANSFSKVQRVIGKAIALSQDNADNIILGNDSNVYSIDFNYATVSVYGFVISEGVNFLAGTKLTVYFYNVGKGSILMGSTDGNAPGIVIPTGVPTALNTIQILSGGVYEFTYLINKTWAITDLTSYYGSYMTDIYQSLMELRASQIMPTLHEYVQAYNPGIPGCLQSNLFSYLGNAYAYKLFYRINKAGDLEISGQWGSVAGIFNSNRVLLFTLPAQYNPSRQFYFPIYKQHSEPAGQAPVALIGEIGYSGNIYVHVISTTSVAATFSMNLQISFKP